jgi:hypothetical protein
VPKRKKKKMGRPPGKPRKRMNVYVLPETLNAIDTIVDRKDAARCSRGKVVDQKFQS